MNRLTLLIQRFPKAILLLLFALTAVSVWYGQQHFKMNADLSSLVEQKGEWVEHLARMEKTFPQNGNVVVLLTSEDGRHLKEYTNQLAGAFRREAIFTDVFAPSSLPWFEQHAIGFLSDSEFSQFIGKTQYELAPAVSAAQAQSVEAYLGQLAQTDQPNLQPLISASSGQEIDWQRMLTDHLPLPNAYVITLSAVPDATTKEPNRAIIEAVNKSIETLDLPSDIKVQVTGQTALDFDEIADANNSIAVAGGVSLIGLVLILAVGIRSLRIIIACYLAVFVGLTWTFAAGLFVVGSYNTISIVFMVMFIGLAVDFSIHLCLHVLERRNNGKAHSDNLREAVAHSFRPLALCALSSAIGFLSFYPTAYTGLGELGVISALGMLLGLVATFVVIPLFFTLFGYPTAKHKSDSYRFVWFGKQLQRFSGLLLAASVLLGGVMGYGATQFQFDFSTLVLKNPASASVEALNDLQAADLGSSYQLFAIAESEQQAQDWKARLMQLDSVSQVTLASDFMPIGLSDRYRALTEALSINDFAQAIDYQAFKRLAKYQGWDLVAHLPDQLDMEVVAKNLFSGLDRVFLAPMQRSTQLQTNDLPEQILQRYVGHSGQWLVTISPSGDMFNVDELAHFIAQTKTVASEATGRAVAEQEVGAIIIKAFQTAILISVFAIALILFGTVEKKIDVILIFIPLGLAAITTLGLMHWFNLSMNMANIIVIPLIFGLGVDNGIHIVKRFRAEKTLTAFFATSTPRASLVSCLTTLATFGALIVADHQGMHSIGLVLSIALVCITVFSLVLLPILLELSRNEPECD